MAASSSSLEPKTLNPPPQQPPPTSSSSQSPQPLFSSLLSTPKPPSSTPSSQISKIQDSVGYPLASSGRGFVPPPKSFRPQPNPDQLVTVANPGGGFPPRSAPQFSTQARSFGFSSQNLQTPSSMRPPSSQFGPRSMGGVTGSGQAPMKSSPAVPHPNNKNATFQSPAPGNGYRDPRDTNRDDMVVTINHRKVRLSDGTSLYALCRSWVRNGMPKETQPQFGEGLKLLPRPLPVHVANSHTPEKNGSGDEDEEKEEEEASAVEDLSAQELLQRHVKRAKKVRARLRKERLQRIERYKQRLALLLPSPVEQQQQQQHLRNNDTPTET